MRFKTRLKPSSTFIDMIPLVDVIFLMLIFFIITSNILPLKSLYIQNPTLDVESPTLTTQLLVVMDAQEVIYLGSKKSIVDFESLKDKLMNEIALLKEKPGSINPTMVLSVDRSVEYDAFLRLFATVQECCVPIRLAYQTNKD